MSLVRSLHGPFVVVLKVLGLPRGSPSMIQVFYLPALLFRFLSFRHWCNYRYRHLVALYSMRFQIPVVRDISRDLMNALGEFHARAMLMRVKHIFFKLHCDCALA